MFVDAHACGLIEMFGKWRPHQGLRTTPEGYPIETEGETLHSVTPVLTNMLEMFVETQYFLSSQ